MESVIHSPVGAGCADMDLTVLGIGLAVALMAALEIWAFWIIGEDL